MTKNSLKIKPSFAPLISLDLFLKSLFVKLDYDKLTAPWLKKGDDYLWLSRSSYSIAIIAKIRLLHNKIDCINIFLPDYICNDALKFIRNKHIKLIFYNVKRNLEPDENSIRKLIKSYKPDIIFQVHYFGHSFNCDFLRKVCDSHGAWLVEDATHLFLPINKIGESGDFVLYSQHKHFSIPNGALLVFHNKNIINKYSIKGLLNLLEIPSTNNDSFFRNIRLILSWCTKKFIQKYILSGHTIINQSKQNSNYSFSIEKSHKVSLFSLRILQLTLPRLEYQQKRKIFFASKLSEYLEIICPQRKTDFQSYIPYLLPFSNEMEFNHLFYLVDKYKFIKNIFPTYTWPDLPPEVISNASKHSEALELKNNLAFIPLHISYKNNLLKRLKIKCKYYSKLKYYSNFKSCI